MPEIQKTKTERIGFPFLWDNGMFSRTPPQCLRPAYFPMQNLEKITPSRSSAVNSPVISPHAT
ncbi:hypothetical protein EPM78_03570 [Neisseria gonorrhoeae]|uniref:Uncharacterized protein n=2 Tax=Neisseria gonorrhoeae TaxID=485 RepID=Q5F528_NEIG1|nr:hypothetical protein NGO_2108 [Neisseria gonorrhoeae FA 1090]ANJ48921.1 hypothetical protein ASO12_11660 [Neisseria gonorrhoeae]EEH61222.1 predicted protein [Neisseria gonorrhoeae 1291]EEZ42716.1 conserved hypothetical protein [Neisseria gonorrhoeae 35/02]EEZ49235.1 predicted protein [Neisseria gonorrhoeae PID18]EEZ51466.1 predicted protein [Neisseria gonorrhoeae PID1]EEZ53893.1 predicted protein [Neisseria gonorrhoeae PID332]EEZ56063.1 predicted protein [Neisseria gonorrhoeae SK-92-679]